MLDRVVDEGEWGEKSATIPRCRLPHHLDPLYPHPPPPGHPTLPLPDANVLVVEVNQSGWAAKEYSTPRPLPLYPTRPAGATHTHSPRADLCGVLARAPAREVRPSPWCPDVSRHGVRSAGGEGVVGGAGGGGREGGGGEALSATLRRQMPGHAGRDRATSPLKTVPLCADSRRADRAKVGADRLPSLLWARGGVVAPTYVSAGCVEKGSATGHASYSSRVRTRDRHAWEGGGVRLSNGCRGVGAWKGRLLPLPLSKKRAAAPARAWGVG